VLRRHWNTRKYGASKLAFPHTKEYLRKVSEILTSALKTFPQPCPGPKKLKINRFEGRQIITCQGRPHVSGRPCPFHLVFLHLICSMIFGAGQLLCTQLPVRLTTYPVFSQFGRQQRAEYFRYFVYLALQNIIKMTERTGSTQAPRRMLWPENQMHSANKIDFEDFTLLELRPCIVPVL